VRPAAGVQSCEAVAWFLNQVCEQEPEQLSDCNEAGACCDAGSGVGTLLPLAELWFLNLLSKGCSALSAAPGYGKLQKLATFCRQGLIQYVTEVVWRRTLVIVKGLFIRCNRLWCNPAWQVPPSMLHLLLSPYTLAPKALSLPSAILAVVNTRISLCRHADRPQGH
jgi:hypothetical protein